MASPRSQFVVSTKLERSAFDALEEYCDENGMTRAEALRAFVDQSLASKGLGKHPAAERGYHEGVKKGVHAAYSGIRALANRLLGDK